MKEIIIAFDVDGTLLNNEGMTVLLLQILSKKMKNTKIYVWSGGGKEYAEKICREYGLEKYVDRCFGKQEYDEELYGKVDICFDNVHSCDLAEKNLIVKMK